MNAYGDLYQIAAKFNQDEAPPTVAIDDDLLHRIHSLLMIRFHYPL